MTDLLTEILRIVNLALAALLLGTATARWRSLSRQGPAMSLGVLGVALVAATALVGSIESLAADVPGGIRVPLTTTTLAWFLVALLTNPIRSRRTPPKET